MLALAAAGAVGLTLPCCSGEAKGDEPEQLAEYGYDPDVPEPGTVETPGRGAKVPPAAAVRAEWLPPVGRQTMPNCFVWASVYGLATFFAARKSQKPPTTPDRQAGPDYAYIRSEMASKIADVGNGQWVQNSRTGKRAGHVMLVVAYNDAYTPKTGAVRVQNSFGTRWGDRGFVWIAYEALEAMVQGRGVYVPASA